MNWTAVKPDEHQIQCSMMEWAGRHPGFGTRFYAFAIPNGAKLPYMRNAGGARFSPQAARLLKEGMKPGVADIGLMFAPGVFVFAEVKKPDKDSKQSPEQKRFELTCRDLGFNYFVVRELADFISLIQRFLTLHCNGVTTF